ncbi:MAG: Cob(I)alamin adenosyltransferase [Candidatus Uhrbacteria bacterium GW2011_GWE2_45_35]|uniref:Cob(I)alamin adenosyltransferase n=2 Tax=Candidatus Uhriibacteriota TaxID=1752732 RepID=A0A0G1LPV0_9BACT|nr:MAG: Cob(I)alamin adenosyltransferase [Candidatus Uhrbacteria bacterium GW2011_GWF2_44_350]KKU07222.1 MAG: Cob(I)alamin adenosyltransferase [Candidatus Uhrbacteria bacterium GW2011_GWE2_45_35]HBR80638.1 cob(I)yrinic acid a,c-diamide adenosyltransferase [Candidatus Uhrbacteria bacterium]HCU31561.1 cob(I)yrinic acid a,c-diamide adenosyltransferase [Candidatus Uhrbacteria bacterium]
MTHQGYGLIEVYTGDGKGKTTASLGLALRAVGAGKKVGIIFFDKGGEHYSERKALQEKLSHLIVFVVTGRDRINSATGRFDFSVTDEDKAEVQRGLDEARIMFADGYELIVLDEFNTVAALGLLSEEDALKFLEEKPAHMELVLTGRHALPSVLQKADLVTEMKMEKHYYYQGVKAREGLDY